MLEYSTTLFSIKLVIYTDKPGANQDVHHRLQAIPMKDRSKR